jgi:hypothetical protein
MGSDSNGVVLVVSNIEEPVEGAHETTGTRELVFHHCVTALLANGLANGLTTAHAYRYNASLSYLCWQVEHWE